MDRGGPEEDERQSEMCADQKQQRAARKPQTAGITQGGTRDGNRSSAARRAPGSTGMENRGDGLCGTRPRGVGSMVPRPSLPSGPRPPPPGGGAPGSQEGLAGPGQGVEPPQGTPAGPPAARRRPARRAPQRVGDPPQRIPAPGRARGPGQPPRLRQGIARSRSPPRRRTASQPGLPHQAVLRRSQGVPHSRPPCRRIPRLGRFACTSGWIMTNRTRFSPMSVALPQGVILMRLHSRVLPQ